MIFEIVLAVWAASVLAGFAYLIASAAFERWSK